MNPLDFWYYRDEELQRFYCDFFSENYGSVNLPGELKQDMLVLFQKGNAYEKGMVLTVLGAVKLFFPVVQ